ncbi:MAG: hypothetical protein JSR85_06490 [Proteobacteria bacterium]|nr:hypothetical protein [Pseudomonadota bacterium]
MRILPFISQQEGYEPSVPELNQEEGVLDISHDAECSLIEESKIAADTLILRCSLHPIVLQNKSIMVQLISEGEPLERTPLYDERSITYGYEREIENSQTQGIALEYTGTGRGLYQGEPFVFHEKTLPSGQLNIKTPLYVKPFQIESKSHQERQTTLPSGHVFTSPPGVLDTPILRGYGGYYKENCALEDIQQVYYALTPTHNQTKVRLYRSEQHLHIIQNEESLTLPGALAAGYAHINVTTEFGNISFTSFLCERVSGHSTLVNVYFKP